LLTQYEWMLDHCFGCISSGSVKQRTATAQSRADVGEFYSACPKASGTNIGPPGLRDPAEGYLRGYYARFVLDPKGNNIEAVFRGG
jgi:hypothetical protein